MPPLRWMICLGWLSGLGTAFLGCGPAEPFRHVSVDGKVLFEDGALIPAARIEVVTQPLAKPVDEKTNPRPGRAEVDVATGKLGEFTTHKPFDGLVQGPHKVMLTSYDEQGQRTTLIPLRYRDSATTTLEFDTANSPWEIRVARE